MLRAQQPTDLSLTRRHIACTALTELCDSACHRYTLLAEQQEDVRRQLLGPKELVYVALFYGILPGMWVATRDAVDSVTMSMLKREVWFMAWRQAERCVCSAHVTREAPVATRRMRSQWLITPARRLKSDAQAALNPLLTDACFDKTWSVIVNRAMSIHTDEVWDAAYIATYRAAECVR
jgi:hypothetical protein